MTAAPSSSSVALLPFEEERAFVDEEFVHELAPPGARFHGYRSVGAAARTYRWRPPFYRAGRERGLDSHDPGPFFRRARTLLQLLGMAHAVPVLPLAELSRRIDRSASRLLGTRLSPPPLPLFRTKGRMPIFYTTLYDHECARRTEPGIGRPA